MRNFNTAQSPLTLTTPTFTTHPHPHPQPQFRCSPACATSPPTTGLLPWAPPLLSATLQGQVFPRMRNFTTNHKMTGVGNALKRHYQVFLLEYEQVGADGCIGLSRRKGAVD